jgi:hypothetical protein
MLAHMTRERVNKPDLTVQRQPETTRASTQRASSRTVTPTASLTRNLEAKPLHPQHLERQRQQALEVQRQANLERAAQAAHLERHGEARASQQTWQAAANKTLDVQRSVKEHAQQARVAQDTRASFVNQRQTALLEGLVTGRLEETVRPVLPEVRRPADLTLGHVADHMGDKARGQIRGDPNALSNYAGFKNAGATLVNHFRKPGSSHTMQDLAGAIGRFTDVGQRGAVESAAFAAFGNHPSFSAQLQRALDDQDSKLEVQREAWQRELEPVAQRQALEESQGEGAAARIEAARGGGQPLPEGVRKLLEAKWNTDLSRVRVHVDGEADALSKKFNARAFTTGNHVFFRSGTWNPTSLEGLQLIAHETWHTVQQAQGLVQGGIDRDAGLETEARGKGNALSSQDLTVASSNAVPGRRGLKGAVQTIAARASSGFAPLTSRGIQRDPQPTPNPQEKPVPKGIPVNRRGGVINEKDGGGVNLRAKPDSSGAAIRRVPAGTLFDVLEEVQVEEHAWYKVNVVGNGGGSGFVRSDYIKLAPDRAATLHRISGGESAIGIAERYYSSAVQRGEDLRFYVNVLHHVNPTSMPNPSGDNWREAKALKDFWIWVPSVTFAQTLRGKVKTGSITGGAYDAVKDSAEAMVKATIEQLPGGKQVLETISSIGANAAKVFNNPGAFVSNLGNAVNQGFNQFTANLPQHLEASVMKLFTGTMGNIELPKTMDATGVLHIGLQVALGGTPQQIEAKLIGQIPGGMATINAASEAKTAFSSLQKDGFAPTVRKYYEGADLQSTIVSGVKQYVIGTVVKQGLTMLASLFVPGAGIIQAAIKLYETIKFIWDKMKDIAETVRAITSSFAEIAAGNIGAAAGKVKDSLVGMLGLAVTFLARVAKLDGIGAWVQKKLAPIKNAITNAWNKFVTWFKALVSRGGSRANPASGTKGTKDPEHDQKVAKGLAQIESEEATIDAKDNDGKLTKTQAEQVARKVKQDNPIFSRILVHYNPKTGSSIAGHTVNKPEIVYEWFASNGARVSSRKPYTDDLEPAADEGTRQNPFPLNWPKPASANYPKIYLGGKQPSRVEQSALARLVGQADLTGTIVQAYDPHVKSTLPGGEIIGLDPRWQIKTGDIVGPVAPEGVSTPGGARINRILHTYGFRAGEEQLQGDHVHEMQVGGQDVIGNLWPLAAATNRDSGGIIDRYDIQLASGKTIKTYQLRQLVKTSSRQFFFKIASTNG